MFLKKVLIQDGFRLVGWLYFDILPVRAICWCFNILPVGIMHQNIDTLLVKVMHW